ncbi:hypothetical protein F4779DRAFT_467220 [Xylariaceae sp. FL0662B]|nr:hypothetical protein F4779DRAFT_467220 [Xylariaceae sp. FL0662B]
MGLVKILLELVTSRTLFFVPPLALVVLFGNYGLPSAALQYLHLTALVSDQDGKAAFECWEISTPFSSYPTVGNVIPGLADVANVSYVVLPPRSNEGLHRPPHPMFFVLLSGSAHVTLPDGKADLWIRAGTNGLMVATDTIGQGHYTEYPSDELSVALQIPFLNGVLPEHLVANRGVCEPSTAAVNKSDVNGWPIGQKVVI